MKALGLLIGAGVLALAAGQAGATVSLYIGSGSSNTASYVTGSSTGQLNYLGDYGGFTNSVSAFGSPTVSSPSLLSQSINVSSATAGSISLYIVQSGTTSVYGSLLSSFTANSFMGNVLSVVESTYYSATDPFASGTLNANLLGTATFNAIGTSTSTNSLNGVTQPFYEVAKYTITTGAGGGSANDTINVSGVPEPGTWAMALAGFGFMGFAMRQRRRATVSYS